MRTSAVARKASTGPARCRKKFLSFFPKGFHDPTYIDWERGYKWDAHERWREQLAREVHRELIADGQHAEVARRAVSIESRTNLLFSFEKMALRDAIKSPAGATAFAEGLFDFLYGRTSDRARFERWCDLVGDLPRRQTRVLTWPLVTVFGFLALPDRHFFLKPTVTRAAAREYGYDFRYRSRPNWETYSDLLNFGEQVARDLSDLRPRDMIDIQSFLWVQGSDEYED